MTYLLSIIWLVNSKLQYYKIYKYLCKTDPLTYIREIVFTLYSTQFRVRDKIIIRYFRDMFFLAQIF